MLLVPHLFNNREYDPSSDTHHARRSHKRRWARRGSDPEPHREDPEAHDEDLHEEKEEKEEEYWSPRHKKVGVVLLSASGLLVGSWLV
jgi:hypothetical protein